MIPINNTTGNKTVDRQLDITERMLRNVMTELESLIKSKSYGYVHRMLNNTIPEIAKLMILMDWIENPGQAPPEFEFDKGKDKNEGCKFGESIPNKWIITDDDGEM